ncbi:hypothetical protein GCM10023224_05510 [Streptomonospora halophila]|uniref:KOW motif-containing protein n=1 Tax=Streptomonospora halophila TaxID=427369 RepID=A0ABP9G904_9ACTN
MTGVPTRLDHHNGQPIRIGDRVTVTDHLGTVTGYVGRVTASATEPRSYGLFLADSPRSNNGWLIDIPAIGPRPLIEEDPRR